jgi:hypothetical protein
MSFTSKHVREVQPQLPLLTRLGLGSQAYGLVALSKSATWLRGWHEYFYPSGNEPNASKTYKTRPNLPVRYVIQPVPHSGWTIPTTNTFKYIKAMEQYTNFFPASSFLPTLQM